MVQTNLDGQVSFEGDINKIISVEKPDYNFYLQEPIIRDGLHSQIVYIGKKERNSVFGTIVNQL